MISTTHRINTGAVTDATVPLNFMWTFEHESLRWPPPLDHAAIVRRLVAIRESGPFYRNGIVDLTLLFTDVERMSAAQIASSVRTALAWTENHPGYGFLAEQLQIVSVSLKNL